MAPSPLFKGRFTAFMLRGPRERAIGMYNMLTKNITNVLNFDGSDKARSRIEKPEESDIQWRLSKFLGWLQTHPALQGNDIYFTPQAAYAGIGCNWGLLPICLVGRSERYVEAFEEIGRPVPQLHARHRSYLERGGMLPPWYNRMHDARSDWFMVPCLLNRERL